METKEREKKTQENLKKKPEVLEDLFLKIAVASTEEEAHTALRKVQ